MPKPLTKLAVENAKARSAPYKLYDTGGLFLIVTPTGGKWWRFKFHHGGKEKLLSLGTYPDVSLAHARTKRDEARALKATGIDPAAARKAAKREAALRDRNSFEAVAREWYSKRLHVWAAGNAVVVLRRLESNLFPDLGSRPIAQIEAPELLDTLRTIEARGSHEEAARTRGLAGQVFRYAIATGRCKRDPSHDLRGALAPHKPGKMPAVKPDELPALLRAIDGYRNIGDTQTELALKLLALTFVRPSELYLAVWSEFDLDGNEPTFTIPASRMKARTEHAVPLARQTVAILRELRDLTGSDELVLPGKRDGKTISDGTLNKALARLGYKGRQTAHGFRAVASTILNGESPFRPDVIESQLAHKDKDKIRAAYNRAEYMKERRELMQWWADRLDDLRGAGISMMRPRRAKKG